MLRIHVAPTCLMALSLDDPAMQRELHVTVTPEGFGYVIEGKAEDMEIVLDDIHERTDASGWDQPATWTRACRTAWAKMPAQCAAQGYKLDVVTRGGTERARLTWMGGR